MNRTLRLCLLILAGLTLLPAVVRSQGNPPPFDRTFGRQTRRPARATTAVVVKSWHSEDLSVWEYFNQHWQNYGSTEIWIDHTSLIDNSTVSLADLEASGADVVILSDPSGGLKQWTQGEVLALQTYALQGHNLIGTYLLLELDLSNMDNRILAPLWGLREDLQYPGYHPATYFASILDPGNCAFRRISDPLGVGGLAYVQLPSDGTWDPSDLVGASFLARSQDGVTIVSGYNAGAYYAFFVDYMPEFQTGEDPTATQLLYNMIACEAVPTPTATTSWGGLKALYHDATR